MVESLRGRAALHPERVALISDGQRVSYGELWGRILSAADEFSRCGVGFGDRVLLAALSEPAFAYGYFATHLLGAVAVPFDPQAPRRRRDWLIESTAAKLVFDAQAGAYPGLGQVRSISDLGLLPARAAAFAPPALDALADLTFTSGTTGRPKGVCLTQRNIAAAAHHINTVIRSREADVEVLPIPLYASFGLGRLRCSLIAGRSVVLVRGFRLPGDIFTALDRHGAAGLVGVPAAFAVLLRFGARGLGPFADRLRYIEIGSAPMPIENKRALMKLLPNTELWMHYGLTEASRSAFIEFHRHRDHLDTVGLAAPDVQLNPRTEDGSECGPGESGLLWISGSHVSPGYWKDPELTARSFAGGWVCTGDIAHLDKAGFVHLHGRKDDMINVGGFNVSPDEIEQVLAEHPAVSEAACIGVPDPRNIAGHVVGAYLVPVAGQARAADAELTKWVAARLESYKVPTCYRWVATLPRTASGKLVRRALRDEASSRH